MYYTISISLNFEQLDVFPFVIIFLQSLIVACSFLLAVKKWLGEIEIFLCFQGKFPTTPPPQKRNKLYPDVFHPLTKSPSHESQLSMRVNLENDLSK